MDAVDAVDQQAFPTRAFARPAAPAPGARAGKGVSGPGPQRLPLSPSQRSLLVVDRLVGVGHLYNSVYEVELAPGPGEREIRAALTEVLAVQPALRLVFPEVPEPHARLAPGPEAGALALECGEDTSAQAVAEAAARLGTHTWDLARGPLYRFVLLAGPSRCVLLFVVHHLVFDAVSVRCFLRDLRTALEGGRSAGETARLAGRRTGALVREAETQSRVGDTPATADAARAWAASLAHAQGAQGVLNPLPHRPAETAFAGRRHTWLLDAGESAALARTARTLGLTEYEFLLAVYGAVVARHTAASQVIIGSPFMARRTAGSFELCGFFVNTLPLAFGVDWAVPFDRYAQDTVRAVVGAARSAAGVSFDQIVRHAQPDRSSNRNPVFSCMLAMQEDPSPALGGPVTAIREHGNGTAKFDLWLGVTPVGECRRLELEYDTQLIGEGVAQALAGSLRGALARAVREPATVLAALFDDVPPPATPAPATPAARSLDEWVRRTASARPDAVALQDGGQCLTYRELQEQVARSAAGLRRAGVGPGAVVAVASGSVARTVTAILAVLRAGAAYLPFDRSLPAQRIEYMLRAAGCRLVVADAQDRGTGSGGGELYGVRALTPADLAAAGGRDAEAAAPAAPADRERSVYVMFSSGSSGRPKAIEMGEGPLLNLTAWQLRALRLDGSTRFLQYAPLGFDVSFQEIFPTLAAGGTVVGRGQGDRRDLPALVRRVEQAHVTHVYLPVAALRPFVQAALDTGVSLARLRSVCVSGEQLFVDDVVRGFFRDRPHLELINLYGPTETHAVTTHRMAADTDWPAHAPIGRPLEGVRAYVTDVTGHLAPPGVRGELRLGGVCPAKGYLGRPDLTARSFRPDPHATGGRLYLTGDQVVRDEDGVLYFLGRTDEQVKIRGHRVELGEIEMCALAAGSAGKAVAAVRDTPAGGELALFLLPAPGARSQAALDAVREALTARLPEYMVPRWILWTDAVAVTANGKVDRAALLAGHAAHFTAAPATAGTGAGADYADAVESALAAMWAELLGLDAVGAQDSLLELGAHSLMVFTALARVRQEHGAEISLRSFFRAPTIASMARQIRCAPAGAGAGRL